MVIISGIWDDQLIKYCIDFSILIYSLFMEVLEETRVNIEQLFCQEFLNLFLELLFDRIDQH